MISTYSAVSILLILSNFPQVSHPSSTDAGWEEKRKFEFIILPAIVSLVENTYVYAQLEAK
jgi:hypothetical protein